MPERTDEDAPNPHGSIDRVHFGGLMKSARAAARRGRGITAAEVATKMRAKGYRVSSETISYYETGRRRIPLDHYWAFLEITETPDSFFHAAARSADLRKLLAR